MKKTFVELSAHAAKANRADNTIARKILFISLLQKNYYVSVQVTWTFRVSPLKTALMVPKSAPPRSVPVAPPLVLSSFMNAPYTSSVALMLNTAFAAELLTDPPEIVPGVNAGSVALEYGVIVAQPAWEDMISPATMLPVSFNPTYHNGVVKPVFRVASRYLFSPAVTTMFLNSSRHFNFENGCSSVHKSCGTEHLSPSSWKCS